MENNTIKSTEVVEEVVTEEVVTEEVVTEESKLKVVDFYTANGNPSNAMRDNIKAGVVGIMMNGLEGSGLNLKPNVKGEKVLYDTIAEDIKGDKIYMTVKVSITTKHPDTPPVPKDKSKTKAKTDVKPFTL